MINSIENGKEIEKVQVFKGSEAEVKTSLAIAEKTLRM